MVMPGADEEGRDGLWSLPKRASQRIVQDLRHDIGGFKRKIGDILPSTLDLFIERWLGFWITLIGLTFTIGGLGMALVFAAELGNTNPTLSRTIPGALEHIWTVGLLVVLTYGAVLVSLLLVSAVRFVLWGRNTYLDIWTRDTPPFSTATQEEESAEWPPTDQQRQKARIHARDYLGNGAVLFISILFILLLLESIATETLNKLLSSSLLTVIGNSIDVGVGILDFNGALGTAAPNANQPELVLFVLFFGPPAAVMAIGTRNLLYLVEGSIRTHIENVREGGIFSWSTAFLVSALLYSIGICANIIIQWA